MKSPTARSLSQLYLTLVPIISAVLGFGVGHVSYQVYLPLWLLNVSLMVSAAWILGFRYVGDPDPVRKQLAVGAFFQLVPWILVSMFSGLGPPPETFAGWTETATGQQIRYFMLIVAGICIAFGFVMLRDSLRRSEENLYSLIGAAGILMAIPVFIVNMAFWGFFLTELFKTLVASRSEVIPDWVRPIRQLFGMLSVVEVALTYLATAAFARSLRLVGWFGKAATRVYIGLSLLAFLIIVLSAFLPEPFVTAGFAVSIPAFPFLMPYFMGINLLKQVGRDRAFIPQTGFSDPVHQV